MRIISDLKDYYDCIQGKGQDRSLTFLRQPKTVVFDDWPFPQPIHGNYFSAHKVFIVGFCGQIYPLIEFGTHNYDKLQKRPVYTVTARCFSMDDIDAFVDKALSSKQAHAYRTKKGSTWMVRSKLLSSFSEIIPRHSFVRFFEECKKSQKKFLHVFTEEHSPVFVARLNDRRLGNKRQTCTIEYNTVLQNCDFHKIVDAYTAFQEIAMFLASMAMPEKEMPPISDELQAQRHGFDKHSFRTPPGGR